MRRSLPLVTLLTAFFLSTSVQPVQAVEEITGFKIPFDDDLGSINITGSSRGYIPIYAQALGITSIESTDCRNETTNESRYCYILSTSTNDIEKRGQYHNLNSGTVPASDRTALDFDVASGAKVIAAKAGTVSEAEYNCSITIDHGDGSRVTYLHVDKHRVSVGDKVNQGDVLAKVRSENGDCYQGAGGHLHFEPKKNNSGFIPKFSDASLAADQGYPRVIDSSNPATFESYVSSNQETAGTRLMLSGDINLDGHDDIITFNDAGDVLRMLANGDGTYQEVQRVSYASFLRENWFSPNYHNRVYMADIDGQKGEDIVGFGSDGRVYYMLSNGDGTFKNKTSKTTSTFTYASWFSKDYNERVWLGDINGDGKDDLVGINLVGDVAYQLSNGDGSFAGRETLTAQSYGQQELFPWNKWFTTQYRNRMWVANIDGQFGDDIVGLDLNGKVNYMLSTGNSQTPLAAKASSSTISFTYDNWFSTNYDDRVWLEDINGDSKADFVGVLLDGDVAYHLATSNAAFNETRVTKTFNLNYGDWFGQGAFSKVWFGNSDDDANVEIFARNTTSGTICSGEFQTQTTCSALTYQTTFGPTLTINQVDGPTDPNDSTVSIAWTDSDPGMGAFSARVTDDSQTYFPYSSYFSSTNHSPTTVVDVDGDGSDDLITLYNNGNYGQVKYALSLGDGEYGPRTGLFDTDFNYTNWLSTNYRRRVWFGDVSGDGKADIVGININGDVFTYLATETLGQYSSKIKSNVDENNQSPWGDKLPYNPWFTTSYRDRVWLADINGDEKKDIVGVYSDGKIYYKLSLGNGHFGTLTEGTDTPLSWTNWFSNDYNNRVWFTDVDGQYGDDLVGVELVGKVHTYLSTGVGTYGSRIIDTDNGSSDLIPYSNWFSTTYRDRVFMADINGDGWRDVAGFDINGNVHYKLSQGNGQYANRDHKNETGFGLQNWFSTSFSDRVWLGDVDGNGNADAVGVVSQGYIFSYLGDQEATINLYYDTDNQGEDGVQFANNLLEQSEVDSFDWNISQIPNGTYYIYAVIEDNFGRDVDYYATPVVINRPSAPTDVTLSSNQLDPNQPVGSVIGTLSAADPNSGEIFAYSLVEGIGDNDNTRFTIDGNQLKTNEDFSQTSEPSYSIRVRVTDSTSLVYEEVFELTRM